MPERRYKSYPTNWVNKNDLHMSSPELREQIGRLTDSDMAAIAKMIGDAVADTYDVAIDEILFAYLHPQDTNTSET